MLSCDVSSHYSGWQLAGFYQGLGLGAVSGFFLVCVAMTIDAQTLATYICEGFKIQQLPIAT